MKVPVIPGRDRASVQSSVSPSPTSRFAGIGNYIADGIIWFSYTSALWFGLSLMVEVILWLFGYGQYGMGR